MKARLLLQLTVCEILFILSRYQIAIMYVLPRSVVSNTTLLVTYSSVCRHLQARIPGKERENGRLKNVWRGFRKQWKQQEEKLPPSGRPTANLFCQVSWEGGKKCFDLKSSNGHLHMHVCLLTQAFVLREWSSIYNLLKCQLSFVNLSLGSSFFIQPNVSVLQVR